MEIVQFSLAGTVCISSVLVGLYCMGTGLALEIWAYIRDNTVYCIQLQKLSERIKARSKLLVYFWFSSFSSFSTFYFTLVHKRAYRQLHLKGISSKILGTRK